MFIQLRTRIIASPLLVAAVLLASPAFAQAKRAIEETAQKINAANELVRQGEYENAISEYQQVQLTADSDELNYNLAVAQFRNGDIDSAQTLFAESASAADTSIAANSRYNLGNCSYSRAIRTAEQDKPAAIEQLREAISNYRDSLRLDSNNADARANIELAAELIRKLKEELKQEEQKQEEQKQQEDQQQEQKKDQQQNKDEQDEQQSDSQKSDSQQSQDSESKGQQDQQQDQSGESKSDKQDSGRQESDQPSDSNDSESGEQKAPESNDDKEGQKNSQDQQRDSAAPSQKPTQSQPESQSSNESQSAAERSADEIAEQNDTNNQETPTGQLTSAGEQDETQKPNGSVAMADPNAKDNGLMTKEEAMKMLQAVRDRDMLRRLRQDQIERSRHVPVDKDW